MNVNCEKVWSNRANEWFDFSNEVFAHIEEYTVPQYGDAPDDQMSNWTIEECLKSVGKRLARYGRQSREGQQELDFKKMAHEIQIAYTKYMGEQNAIEEQERRDCHNATC